LEVDDTVMTDINFEVFSNQVNSLYNSVFSIYVLKIVATP